MLALRPALTALAVAVCGLPAAATQINSGEPDGAYHSTFCPALERELAKSGFSHKCTPSNGTADNVARIAREPSQLGFGQLDVFAHEVARHGGASAFTRLRVDDARECLFAVTRNREITNYGEIAVFASRLKFILPPANSGSAATFRYLQQIDPAGVGTARNVTNAASTDEALRTALATDDGVALFVQFPDRNNARFKLIQQLGGHIVPVIDRTILRQQIEDRKIYFAQETEVSNARWLKTGTKVITACTPLVLFTGHNDRVTSEKAKADHKDLIATVVVAPKDALVPRESVYDRIARRTRELTSRSAENVARLAEDAREKSKPWVEKAKDASSKAIEKARPAYERARDATGKAYERAKEEVKELLEELRPDPPKQ